MAAETNVRISRAEYQSGHAGSALRINGTASIYVVIPYLEVCDTMNVRTRLRLVAMVLLLVTWS